MATAAAHRDGRQYVTLGIDGEVLEPDEPAWIAPGESRPVGALLH